MDVQEEFSEPTKKTCIRVIVLRCLFVLLFFVFAFLSLSVLIGFVAFFIGNFSLTSPISVPSQCKIVSSTVDLRSSKVCELGPLNYKAKHVFYPFERKTFRCRYDYYWASVFKVEYKDHSLGQTRLAFAEAPNEALPLYCRPNFGSAWLTKDKFKVNGSYDCWYTSGFSKVNIYKDNFFSCQAKDPSAIEMIRRYYILSTRILQSWYSSRGRARYWRWDVIAGVFSGFVTSLITISLVKILQEMKAWLPKIQAVRRFPLAIFAARFKRTCFFILYFSFIGLLTMQYGRRVGLLEYQY